MDPALTNISNLGLLILLLLWWKIMWLSLLLEQEKENWLVSILQLILTSFIQLKNFSAFSKWIQTWQKKSLARATLSVNNRLSSLNVKTAFGFELWINHIRFHFFTYSLFNHLELYLVSFHDNSFYCYQIYSVEYKLFCFLSN